MTNTKTIEMPRARGWAGAYLDAVAMADRFAARLTPAARVTFWLWLSEHAQKAAAAADESRKARKAVA